MAKQVLLDSYALYQFKVSKPCFSNNPTMALIQEGRGFNAQVVFSCKKKAQAELRRLGADRDQRDWLQRLELSGGTSAALHTLGSVPSFARAQNKHEGQNQTSSEEHTEGNSPHKCSTKQANLW